MSDLLSQTRKICQLMEIKPRHSQGQNFLINEEVYDEIIKVAQLDSTETVLEIGPGLGFLTMKLAQQVKKVIAVELDSQLADYLKMGIASQNISNVEIVNGDILHFNPHLQLSAKKYKIVANLPYNITSIFLRYFLSGSFRPQSLTLMLQKEVAERIVAQAPRMSILAISVQYYARAKIIRIVNADNFWPRPRVDSALINIVLQDRKYSISEEKEFFRVVKIAFSSKRKMLKNNLAAGLKIETKKISQLLVAQDFNPQIRAENLSLPDWHKLFAALKMIMV